MDKMKFAQFIPGLHSMNSTSLVRLGYGEWVYPYFYQSTGVEEPSGFLADLWKHIAPNHVYMQYSYGNLIPVISYLKCSL